MTKAKVNNHGKKIKILKSYQVKSFEDLPKPFSFPDKLILAFDSSQAVTAEGFVNLKRAAPPETISESELDTLVFRGFWEFLNRYRTLAAKKLRVPDLDLILVGAEIRDIRLRNYRVFNPLGFKSERLGLRFRGTFIPRNFLPLLEKLKSWAKNFIVVEGGQIQSSLVSTPADYVLQIGSQKTAIFPLNDECMHSKDIAWGTDKLIQRISGVFGVEDDVAPFLLYAYLENRVSKRLDRFIGQNLKQELANLFKLNLFRRKTGSAHSRVYFQFNSLNFGSGALGRFNIRQLNFREYLERQGFSIIIKPVKHNFFNNYDGVLAFITAAASPSPYHFLNQMLSRRSKWLTAQT